MRSSARAMGYIAHPSSSYGILGRVAALVPSFQDSAAALDAAAAFPVDALEALRDAGALALMLPIETTDTYAQLAADHLAYVLAYLGLGNLALGRIFEAHVNARHLIARYGSPAQQAAATLDARAGELFALWVTDPRTGGLRVMRTRNGLRLEGQKMFCSAAGHATRALVTALDDAGEARMLVLSLGGGEQVIPGDTVLQGMRAAVTDCVDFSGVQVSEAAMLGAPGDYLREPDFSAGAWRGSAVAFGGLCALLNLAQAQLSAADRLDNAHQLARLGTAMIGCETSRLWLRQAARLAERRDADPARAVSYVGLARIAIETACLDAMRLVQRSLGLSAFKQGSPVERICRDLATYLRQPAPDETLTNAAAHFARQVPAEWP